MSERTYTPMELCRLFDISKSTLFRWEKEEWFPPVGRVATGNTQERRYTSEHIAAISRKRQEGLGKSLSFAMSSGRMNEMQELMRQNSLTKFLEGSLEAVRELEHYPSLSEDEIITMLGTIVDRYSPRSEFFIATLRTALRHCEQLSRTEKE